MNKLLFVNYILQFFFVRLVKVQKKLIDDFKITEISLSESGNYELGGLIKNYKTIQWYEIHGFIKPFSGWRNDFKTLGKKFKFKLTSEKIIENEK